MRVRRLREEEGHLTDMTKCISAEISPPPRKIKDRDAWIDAINTGANAPKSMDALRKQIEFPFTERVMRVRISPRLKLPSQLEVYEGKTDFMDHLDSYKTLMSL